MPPHLPPDQASTSGIPVISRLSPIDNEEIVATGGGLAVSVARTEPVLYLQHGLGAEKRALHGLGSIE